MAFNSREHGWAGKCGNGWLGREDTARADKGRGGGRVRQGEGKGLRQEWGEVGVSTVGVGLRTVQMRWGTLEGKEAARRRAVDALWSTVWTWVSPVRSYVSRPPGGRQRSAAVQSPARHHYSLSPLTFCFAKGLCLVDMRCDVRTTEVLGMHVLGSWAPTACIGTWSGCTRVYRTHKGGTHI